MGKIRSFAVLVCILSVASAWGAGFRDEFDRPNGAVGNGWSTQEDGTITVTVVDNEVLISGEQGTDWVRSGLSRSVSGETKVSFDFMAETFNVHLNLGSADSSAYVEIYAWVGGAFQYANSEDGGWPGWVALGGPTTISGEYNTVVVEQNGADFTITLNGEVAGTITNNSFVEIDSILISSDAAAGTAGTLHIDNVQIGEVVTGAAMDPSPASGATDVPRDVALGWTAASEDVTHDVYFGMVLEDVTNATRADALAVLVSQGQNADTYDPDGLLEFGQTYYWRIDEVEAAPDNTITPGEVWSFTVEPFVYEIENVVATASSSEAEAGPENTVNGSGLNANDQHSIEATDMWLTNAAGDQSAWIQYEFDSSYKLYEMQVWNYNVQFEAVLGFGLKNVTVEYSTDGAEWTALGDYEFAQATSRSDYAANTIIDLEGVVAKYVRLTAADNWGGVVMQFGLSEVRFIHKPVFPSDPVPASGESGVDLDVALDWRGGREAATHEVSFSSDRAAVEAGTAPVEAVTETAYEVGSLDLGTIYYWKVAEVNEAASPSVWEGDIWSFSTKEFLTVEDFESYDDVDNRIYDTWIDGWVNGTGSTVGYLDEPFAERSIVYSGWQAMPLEYNNTASPYYSEAERDLGAANWTLSGADALAVHFRGQAATTADTPGNDPAPLYVAIEDGAGRTVVVAHPDPEASVTTEWQTWIIPFSDLGNISLNNVAVFYVGVGDRENPTAGGAGLVFIDDIQVGRVGVADPGSSGLVAHYALEENVEDSSASGHHGTAVGDPVYVPGQVGMGLEFDGTGNQYVDLGTLNPSAATGQLSVSLWAKWNGLSGLYQGLIGKRDTWAADDMMWQIEANVDTGVIYLQREGLDVATTALPEGEWTHVAITCDGTTATVYRSADVAAEAAFTLGTDADAAMVFGASVAGGGNPFNGALDEIRIYDRVLSPFEIRYLANQ